jgi:hypothetical protein
MLAAKIGYFRPTGFDPRSISGLASWWDAADASTITTVSGAVSRWNDKVGSRNLIQNTETRRPAYTANYYQGLAAVTFDGSDDSLAATSLPSLAVSPLTFIACIDSLASSGATDRGVLLLGTSANTTSYSNGGGLQLVANSLGRAVRKAFEFYARASSGGLEVEVADLSTAQPVGKRILSVTANGTTGSLFQSGAQVDSQSASVATSTDRVYFGSLLESNSLNFFWNGRILEVVVFNRALTSAERLSVELYLASKWGAPVAPQVSNADAQSWINRVYANGGTVNPTTAAAVNNFCDAIDSAGIRDRFYRLNLFCGTGLSSALVPLYRGQSLGGTQLGGTTDTNNNFVAGDYVETGATGGLKGNGTNKSLSTGVAANLMTATNIHFSARLATPETQNAFKAVMGVTAASSPFIQYELYARRTASTPAACFGDGSAFNNRFGDDVVSSALAAGHIVACWPSMYRNGVQSGAQASLSQNTPLTQGIAVFGLNNPSNSVVQNTDARVSSYSIGLAMTAAQVASYSNAMSAFNAALSRT